MNSNGKLFPRFLLFVIGTFALLALPSLFGPAALMQQSGGPYILNPSVISGGGGLSSNGNTNVTGTIGQGVLGTSSGGVFSLNAGFWQAIQSPAATNSISGTISYCIDQSKKVLNATVATTSGSPSDATTTNASGFYQLHNLGVGPYAVAPSKTGAVSGISAFDAALVAQYAAGIATPTSCQQLGGDASNNGALSAFDAALIAQTAAGISNSGIAGTWKFVPASRSYPTLNGNLPNENYNAVLVGDVSGNWIPAGPEGPPKGPMAAPNAPLVSVSVSLPTMVSGGAATVLVPIIVGDTTGQGIIAYDFTFTFNPSVLQLQATPFSTTGTLSAAGWNITPNTATPGQIRIVAFNTVALSGQGTLIFLKFNVVGAGGATTPMTWTNFVFNEGDPVASPLTNGNYTVTGPTAVKLEKFTATGYDGGVYVEWETGFEVNNLGFRIHRDQGGSRTLLNPQIVAGSALMAGSVALSAGRSSSWWDGESAGKDAAAYWLEDIDLNGASTWHGPFYAKQIGGKPPAHSQAESLSQVGQTKSAETTHAVEDFAQPPSASQSGSSPVALQQASLASSRTVKIGVRRAGWYRVSQAELINSGLDPKTDPRTLRLFVDGAELPIFVAGEEDGRFDATDSVEFYGLGLNTPSTDTRVYWLSGGGQAGLRITKTPFAKGYSSGESFAYTVERRDRTIYFSGLKNGDEENFFGAVVTGSAVDQKLTLNNLASSARESATIEVSLQGATTLPHQVIVSLNGESIGRVAFNGQAKAQERIEVPQAMLREGDNIVTLQSINGPSDINLVDSISITYQHSYRAEHDLLSFTAKSGQSATINGFSSRDIRVFDVTDERGIQELAVSIDQAKEGYAASVTAFGIGDRMLLALTEGKSLQASNIKANTPSHLRDATNAADLIIISQASLVDSLKPLVDLRSKQGLITTVADIEDIYDEFNFGDKSPQSIRDFLSYAAKSWKVKPRFVLFTGDSSFDPRNYLGFGDNDLVPTKLIDTAYLETASDDWLADFDGDGIADLSIGRLPVRTANEASAVVNKVLGYERSSSSNEVALVADRNDGFDFEQASTGLRSLIPSGVRVNEIFRSRADDATTRNQLLDAINRGQKIVNYGGHGNVNQWRGNLLTSADGQILTNGDHLSLFVMMTCLNGYFQDPVLDGLAESLLKSETGGAVAVWASSALCLPEQQAAMNHELYRLLFSPGTRGLTLGEIMRQAKAAVSDTDVRRSWILLGDPTMRMR